MQVVIKANFDASSVRKGTGTSKGLIFRNVNLSHVLNDTIKQTEIDIFH